MSAYHLTEKSKKSLIEFLNELNKLLRNHNLSIQFMDGAIFSESIGYLGLLEDNKDQIVINDGVEDIFTSDQINKE